MAEAFQPGAFDSGGFQQDTAAPSPTPTPVETGIWKDTNLHNTAGYGIYDPMGAGVYGGTIWTRALSILFALLFAATVQAQTSTPNLGMTLPQAPPGSWGEQLNNNFSILDTKFPGGQGGHILQNEGSDLPVRGRLNFAGEGVDCVNTSASVTTCTFTTGGGSGTVTSVGIVAHPFFTISGSPITGAGNITLDLSGTPLQVTHGGTAATTPGAARTNLGLAIGTDVQGFDATLAALAAFNTTGLLVQTSTDTFVGRTLTAVSNEITITNPAGTAGNPLIGIADVFTLASKTSTIPWKTGTTAPATCGIGMAFFDTDATAGTNINICTATDTWTQISGGGGGSGHTIQEEGVSLPNRATLNFIGAALTAADDGSSKTNVTLSQSPASGSVVGTGRTISTTSPLGGGGNLTGDLTITCTTCATASGAAAGQVAVMTSATNIDSFATFGFDGTDLTLGDVSTNYVRMVTAALTAPRTLTIPDVDTVTVAPTTATSNQWITHITSGGVQTKAQPAFSNISGVNTVAKGGTSIATIAANKLLGSVGADTIQEIAIGSGLSLAAGTLSASGGAGTPGGSDTQVQFNNAGAFGGDEDFTFSTADKKLHIGVSVLDWDNTPRLWFDHDGTDGIINTSGTGSGAGNASLKLITEGTGGVIISSLTSTGAAGSKKVVCVDTATGRLYASSSDTACAN